MSRLADAAREYITLRRALGFKANREEWLLPRFVAFLEAQGSTVITTDLALRWAQQPEGADPSWHADRLGYAHRFARHLRAFDPRHEVPPLDLLPFPKRRKRPYLYTATEVAALMHHARCLPHPLHSATYTTLIGLLAVTGMRIGEAIALDQYDVDWHRSLISIREAKFKKSRDVPLHDTTLAALHAYARRRDRLRPNRESPSFFVSRVGTRLVYNCVARVFARLLRLAQLPHRPRHRPRIHDMRHSFAMRTVRDWYRVGVDVEARLPVLSAFLGHVNPAMTYWYLSSSPDLLTSAGERLERSLGVLP